MLTILAGLERVKPSGTECRILIKDRQVAVLMQRLMEGKTQETAAAMAGMCVRSARKWQSGPLPSETKQDRWWRTRLDPFDGVWRRRLSLCCGTIPRTS